MTGVDAFRDRLEALGYRGITRDGDYYGYSLALGSAEISLFEQVNAYRTLASGGIYSPLTIWQDRATQNPPTRVMSEEAAFIVADILSDRAGRAVTFGLDNPLVTRFWSAVKTGTSKDMRDNWCIGFSSDYSVGVWVGNFEGDAMHRVSGVTGAAPVWLTIMNALHADPQARNPRSYRISSRARFPLNPPWSRDARNGLSPGPRPSSCGSRIPARVGQASCPRRTA